MELTDFGRYADEPARDEGRAPVVAEDRVRRAVDIAAAALLLVLAAPLFVLCALAVLLDSGRPVLFGHLRLGLGGRPFRCWKFRTMEVGAEERLRREPALRRLYVENGYKVPTRADPRVTRVGRWLRRTYADELPQLFNVLAGSMTLVGPRPIVPEELACYGAGAAELLSAKPGLFGEWTSRGRRRPDYPERARLELDYVRHRSVRRDLRILARSIPVVLRGQAEP